MKSENITTQGRQHTQEQSQRTKLEIYPAPSEYKAIETTLTQRAEENGTTPAHKPEKGERRLNKIKGVGLYIGTRTIDTLRDQLWFPIEYHITEVMMFDVDTQLDLFLTVLKELKGITLIPAVVIMDSELYSGAGTTSNEILSATQDITRISKSWSKS